MISILVGSAAAKITGCLPDWRDGRTDDIDFYGEPDEIISKVSARYDVALDVWSGRGSSVALDPRGTLRIDIRSPDAVSDAIIGAGNLCEVECAGVDCVVIGESTQLALKLAYIRNDGPHSEKNARDIEFWLGRKSPVEAGHISVFLAMWYKAEEIFGLEKSDPRSSWGYLELMDRMNGAN